MMKVIDLYTIKRSWQGFLESLYNKPSTLINQLIMKPNSKTRITITFISVFKNVYLYTENRQIYTDHQEKLVLS